MNNKFHEISQSAFNAIKNNLNTHIVIIVGNKVASKLELLETYFKQLDAPYMGRTWDSLDEVLRDCDCLKADHVYIIHDGWPRLSSDDLVIYEKVLTKAIDTHTRGPIKDCSIPQRKIDFHVALLKNS